MGNGLMEENGSYGASGVLFNGGKWYLRYFGCVVGLFVNRRGEILVMELDSVWRVGYVYESKC